MNLGKVAFAVVLAAGTTAAPAAVVSQTFTLNASNFIVESSTNGTTTVPYSTISGDFTISYDPTLTYVGATSITAANFAFPYTSPVKFDYDSTTNNFSIGAGPDVTTAVYYAYPDFVVNFNRFGGNPAPAFVEYTSNATLYRALTATIASSAAGTPAGAVPEPATWAMMVGGFGLVGGAMRRRQKIAVRFA